MNNSYIKGSVREIFYKTDKGYMVGVFKVYDADRSQDQAKVQLTKEI